MEKKNRDNIEHSWSLSNKIATVITAVLIGVIFFVYLSMTKVRIDEYAGYTLKNQLDIATVSIKAQFSDANRSIAAAAGEVAAEWRDGGHFDPVELVESIKDKYPFDVLEFVDKDGINLMSGANRFDASDREYFKEGIKGNTGLWINYTPKESKEYLLDYYSPVYHNGEIVGVLVGALGSKSSLQPLTETEYFGRDCIGIIYDKDARAIAGSIGVDGELYASDIYDIFKLTEEDKKVFDAHVAAKDKVVFSYEGEKGTGIACAGELDAYGWGFIIIIPSVTFASVYGDFTTAEIIALGAIVIIVCAYILFILGATVRKYNKKIKEDEDIIHGFSKVYHSVFMLDYSQGIANCLRTRDPIAARFDIKEGEFLSIKDALMTYMVSSADNRDKEKILPLENVMYVRTMMDGREYFSLEYNRAAGGKGSIAIADMKSDVAADDERYLLGITELG